MRDLKLFVFLAAFALSTSTALAQGKAKKKEQKPEQKTEAEAPAPERKKPLHDQVSGTGYGMAGCGLGSIVFGPKPGKIQILAATTNGIGYQTFAITSGTSNCDIPEMDYQAAVFIETNKETIVKDAARGNGETLVGLAQILDCRNTELFGQRIQQNYESIFNEDNSTFESTRQIRKTINSDPELASSCATLG